MPALLDAIEKELAAEEAGLSGGSTAPDTERVLPLKTAQPIGILTAVQPALGTAAKVAVVQQQDSMSPELGTLMTGREMQGSGPTRAPNGLSRAGFE